MDNVICHIFLELFLGFLVFDKKNQICHQLNQLKKHDDHPIFFIIYNRITTVEHFCTPHIYPKTLSST
jgi:hypothetical protein